MGRGLWVAVTAILRQALICAPDFHANLRAVREAYGDRKVLLDQASRHTARPSDPSMIERSKCEGRGEGGMTATR